MKAVVPSDEQVEIPVAIEVDALQVRVGKVDVGPGLVRHEAHQLVAARPAHVVALVRRQLQPPVAVDVPQLGAQPQLRRRRLPLPRLQHAKAPVPGRRLVVQRPVDLGGDPWQAFAIDVGEPKAPPVDAHGQVGRLGVELTNLGLQLGADVRQLERGHLGRHVAMGERAGLVGAKGDALELGEHDCPNACYGPPSMGDHDSLVKRAFGVPRYVAGELRSILPARVLEHLELDALEVSPKSFVSAPLQHRHADLLFRCPFRGRPSYIYFLIEHQSEPDPVMAFRCSQYAHNVWDFILREEPKRETLPLLIVIVVHHGASGWTVPRRLHEIVEGIEDVPELKRFVPDVELLVDDIAELDDAAIAARPLAPFPKVVMWLLRDARNAEQFLAHLSAWGKELERLVHDDPVGDDRLSVMRYILKVAGEIPFEVLQQRLLDVAPAAEETMATAAEQLIAKGIEKGIEKGRVQAMRETLQRLMRTRFRSEVDDAMLQRVAEATPEEVDHWLGCFATAEKPADVFDA